MPVEKTDRPSSGPLWVVAGVIVLAAVALWPSMVTGYWGEDTYYSTIVRGGLVLNNQSIAHSLVEYEAHAIRLGRFYPLTPLIITTVFYLIHDVAVYKAYILSMTLLDLGMFLALVRKLGGSKGFVGLAGVVAISLMQFRVFVDPLLAYYGQIQWMTAAVFVSMLGLIRFLEGRGRRWLVVAGLAYLAAALMYEVAYTLVALHLLLIVGSRLGWKSRLIAAMPFLAVVGTCGGMSFLVRRLFPGMHYLQQPRLDSVAVLTAIARQTSAALPLSYFACDPLKIFDKVRPLGSLTEPRVAAMALAALGLSYASLRQAAKSEDRGISRPWTMLAIGMSLAILPAILIAISPYHQDYLTFGVGWIPVVAQSFGVAMLLATGLWVFLAMKTGGGRFARGKCLAASMLVAGVLGLTYRANIEVAACFNASPGTENYREFAGQHGASWHLPRLNIEAAFDAGLMDEVPGMASVQVFHDYPYWQNAEFGRFFYAKHTNKSMNVVPPGPTLPANPTYQVRDFYQGRSTGFVVLTRVDQDGPTTRRSGLRLFVRSPGLFDASIKVVDSASGQAFRPGRDLPLIESGRDWAIYSLEPTVGRVNPDLLGVVDAATGMTWVGEAQNTPIAGREPGTVIR